MKKVVSALVVSASIALASAPAHAGWIQVVDPNLMDTATNPGFGAGGPASQSAANVQAWLQDLTDTASIPLLGQDDTFSDSSITGLASAGSLYITLHYGRFDVPPVENDVTVAFSCSTDCATFTGYVTQGLSNYRYYGTERRPPDEVPAPGALALIGLGLTGLAMRRKLAK